MNAVQESSELDRILAIPRRVWTQAQADQVVQDLTSAFRTPQGTETLFPTQALALLEIGQLGGLLGPMPVGSGKTLVTLLAPRMLGAKRPLLLLPASLLKKTEKEIPKYRKNWVLPAHIKLCSYESLAMDSHAEFLNAYQPDLIMADEGHKLFNTSASCCRRLGRYMKEHYSTPLVVLSGSLISRQVEDLAHLTNWSLKERNPIPEHFGTVQEWGRALNVNTNDARRLMPGALAKLRHPDRPNQDIREAFRDRLLQTPGVVTFRGSPLPVKLTITSHLLEAPDDLAETWDTLRDDWETPDGWEMTDGIEAWRHARELSVGCYYRWNPRPPEDWRQARSDWGAACREILSTNRRQLDTELQVKKAIHHYPHHVQTLETWQRLRPTFEPNVEAVWESDHALDWILDWAAQSPGIVWVSHKFLGYKLAERGLPYYANGGLCTQTGQAIEDAPPTSSICASVSSNGTGRNLQHWGRNLVVSGPPNGKQWEQCLDAQTEILTPTGWKGIDDDWEDQAAQFDITDGSISWAPAKRCERPLGEGEEMYGIDTPRTSLRVTGGHRMVLSRPRRKHARAAPIYGDLEFVQADSLPFRFKIPRAGLQEAGGLPLSHDDLILVGFFLADGNRYGTRIDLFQAEVNHRILHRLRALLGRLNLAYTERIIRTDSNFGPRSPLHRITLRKTDSETQRGWGYLSDYLAKDMGPQFADISRSQLKALLYGMWLGDGSKTPGFYEYDRYKSFSWKIASSRDAVCDQIQSLCVRRGLSCNVYPSNTTNLITVSLKTQVALQKPFKTSRRPGWARVPTQRKERVWCVSVPTGAIVVRRKGKASIVGNCLGRTHRTGQKRAEVTVDVLIGCLEDLKGFWRAVEDAQFAESMLGQPQKLCNADLTGVHAPASVYHAHSAQWRKQKKQEE